MSELHIGTDLALPLDAAIGRYVVIGKSGSGKTNGDAVFAEEFFRAGVPVVVMDSLGNMRGLRSSKDGEGLGLEIPIFGGNYGDLPLPLDRAIYVADVCAEGQSAILDLSLLSLDEQVEFAKQFLPRILQRSQTNMHIILEEADRFAPQRAVSSPVTMFSRASRNAGIGWTFSTQRPQVLHKEVIDSASVFIAMKMTGELAQDAVGGEIGSRIGRKTAAAMMADLPSFKRGDAWFVPDSDWLGVDAEEWEPRRFRFRLRDTFEVRPPKVGETRREPKVLAAIDLERLREAMVADEVAEQSVSIDVARLNAKILELQHALATRPEPQAPEREIVEVQTFSDSDLAALAQIGEKVDGFLQGHDRIRELLEGLRTEIHAAIEESKHQRAALVRGVSRTLSQFNSGKCASEISVNNIHENSTTLAQAGTAICAGETKLSGPERRILTVAARFPQGRTLVQTAILAGYSAEGGAFKNPLGALRTKGYVERGGVVRITQAGLDALGSFEPLPTGRALIDFWRAKCDKAQRAILDALIDVYPNAIETEEIAQRAGYEPTGGAFKNALGRLRTLQLAEGYRRVKAAEVLFSR